MADEDALVTAQFQVPASEVQAGLNGRLLLKAKLHAASSETIKHTEDVKNVVEQVREDMNEAYDGFSQEVTSRLGYKLRVNTVDADSYTLQESDSGGLVRMTSANENEVVVPAHSDVAFETGVVINVRQVGNGATTVVGADGVTINSPADNKVDGVDFGVALVKVSETEWDFVKAFKGVPLPEVDNFVTEVEDYFERLEGDLEDTRRKVDNLTNTITALRAELGSTEESLASTIGAIQDKANELDDNLSDTQQTVQEKLDEEAFANDLFENGYQKLPGGLIIQWMKHYFPHTNGDIEARVDLPITFPNANLHPMLSDTRGDIYDDSQGGQVTGYDRESVTVKSYWNRTMGGMTVYIMAIGY